MRERRRGVRVATLAFGLAAAVVLAALLAACSDSEDGSVADGRSYAGTVPAPDFPEGLQWLNVEEPLSIHDDLRGKAVLLDFWTLGCINCQHIIPDLKRLEAEFGSELVVIGVHSGKYDTEKDLDSIRDAVLRYGLEHPVVNDPDFVVWQSYGVNAWPTLMLIDPNGNIVGKFAGEGIYPVFQPVIEGMLNQFHESGQVDPAPIVLALEQGDPARSPLSYPGKVLADPERGRLFVADSGHNRILVVDLESGALEYTIGSSRAELRDGDFQSAGFNGPQGMALSPDGQRLYVADTLNHAVRVVDLVAGSVATLGGTGEQASSYPTGRPGLETQFSSPWDVLLWEDVLFVASAGTHQIWVMDSEGKRVEVFAGSGAEGIDDGTRLRATLAQPEGLATDGAYLYWVDPESSSLRRVAIDGSGPVETLVGTGLFDFGDRDGNGREAVLQHAEGLTYADGLIYVADSYNHKVKTYDLATGDVRTLVGTGDPGGDGERLNEPSGLSVAGGVLYIADRNNSAVRAFDLRERTLRTFETGGTIVSGISAESALGDTLDLPVQRVAPGEGMLTLEVTTPAAYHLNSLAPSRLEVTGGDGDVVRLQTRSLSWQSDEPEVTLDLAATFGEGSTTLVMEATAYYCRDGQEALCFVKRTTVNAPVEVSSSNSAGQVTVRLELPEEEG